MVVVAVVEGLMVWVEEEGVRVKDGRARLGRSNGSVMVVLVMMVVF